MKKLILTLALLPVFAIAEEDIDVAMYDEAYENIQNEGNVKEVNFALGMNQLPSNTAALIELEDCNG